MANRYKVSGGWSTTSGGSSGAAAPTAADDVFFDANSDNFAGSLTCRSLNFTGYTGTFNTNTQAITIGDGTAGASNIALKVVSGMTLTTSAGSSWNFVSTSGTQQTIDFAGKSVNSSITINGAGSSYLTTGAFTTTVSFTVTQGTIDFGTQSHSSAKFLSNNSNTRTISMGTGTFTLPNTGTVWNIATATNLTFNANTSTIKMTDTSSTSKTMTNNASLTYYNIEIAGDNGATFTFSQALTCNTFTVSGWVILSLVNNGANSANYFYSNGTENARVRFGGFGNSFTVNTEWKAEYTSFNGTSNFAGNAPKVCGIGCTIGTLTGATIQAPYRLGTGNNNRNNSAGTSTTVNVSTGTSTLNAKSLVLVGIQLNINTANQVSSVTDSLGNTYSRIFSTINGGTGETELWYAYNTKAGNIGTITVNHTSTNYTVVQVLTFAGNFWRDPLDKSASQISTATPATSGSTATLSRNYELIIGLLGANSVGFTSAVNNDGKFQGPAGAATNGGGAANGYLLFEQTFASAGGTYSVDYAVDPSGNDAVIGIATFIIDPVGKIYQKNRTVTRASLW